MCFAPTCVSIYLDPPSFSKRVPSSNAYYPLQKRCRMGVVVVILHKLPPKTKCFPWFPLVVWGAIRRFPLLKQRIRSQRQGVDPASSSCYLDLGVLSWFCLFLLKMIPFLEYFWASWGFFRDFPLKGFLEVANPSCLARDLVKRFCVWFLCFQWRFWDIEVGISNKLVSGWLRDHRSWTFHF